MKEFTPWSDQRKLNLIQIQTTSTCNARCLMCPYKDSWHAKHPGYMSDKLYDKILNSINDYDAEFSGKFCPYLENEPFADKNLLERVELAYEILKNPYIEISSNMGLLTKKKIDELYSMWENHDFYGKFTISHHGVDKESYEYMMKIPYEKSLENTIYFLQKFQGKIKISIQDMAFSLDKEFQLNPYRKVKRYLNKLMIDNGINPKYIIAEPKVFHNRAGNVKIPGWNYKKIVRQIDKNHPFDCLRIHGCLHVLYTGEVIGCCMDYFKETLIGDLRKQTVIEFFDSNKYKKWVGMVRGEIESPPNFICKRCLSPGG